MIVCAGPGDTTVEVEVTVAVTADPGTVRVSVTVFAGPATVDTTVAVDTTVVVEAPPETVDVETTVVVDPLPGTVLVSVTVLVAQGPTEVLGGQDDDPAVTVMVETAGQVFGTVIVLATHDEPPVGPTGVTGGQDDGPPGTVIVVGTQVPGVFGGQLPGGNVTVDTIVVGEPAGGQALPPVGPTGVPQEVIVTGGG